MHKVFGDRVKLIRQHKGLSQRAFAELLGVGHGQVATTEKLKNTPKVDLAIKMAQSFPDLNTRWLLTGEGAMWGESAAKTSHLEPTTESDLNTLRTINFLKNELLPTIQSEGGKGRVAIATLHIPADQGDIFRKDLWQFLKESWSKANQNDGDEEVLIFLGLGSRPLNPGGFERGDLS